MRVLSKQEWQLVEQPLLRLYNYTENEWDELDGAYQSVVRQLFKRWGGRYRSKIIDYGIEKVQEELISPDPSELTVVIEMLTKLGLEEEAQKISSLYRDLNNMLKTCSYILDLLDKLEPKE